VCWLVRVGVVVVVFVVFTTKVLQPISTSMLYKTPV
jgi:hypothetical protein